MECHTEESSPPETAPDPSGIVLERSGLRLVRGKGRGDFERHAVSYSSMWLPGRRTPMFAGRLFFRVGFKAAVSCKELLLHGLQSVGVRTWNSNQRYVTKSDSEPFLKSAHCSMSGRWLVCHCKAVVSQHIAGSTAHSWHMLVADDFYLEAGGPQDRAALLSFFALEARVYWAEAAEGEGREVGGTPSLGWDVSCPIGATNTVSHKGGRNGSSSGPAR